MIILVVFPDNTWVFVCSVRPILEVTLLFEVSTTVLSDQALVRSLDVKNKRNMVDKLNRLSALCERKPCTSFLMESPAYKAYHVGVEVGTSAGKVGSGSGGGAEGDEGTEGGAEDETGAEGETGGEGTEGAEGEEEEGEEGEDGEDGEQRRSLPPDDDIRADSSPSPDFPPTPMFDGNLGFNEVPQNVVLPPDFNELPDNINMVIGAVAGPDVPQDDNPLFNPVHAFPPSTPPGGTGDLGTVLAALFDAMNAESNLAQGALIFGRGGGSPGGRGSPLGARGGRGSPAGARGGRGSPAGARGGRGSPAGARGGRGSPAGARGGRGSPAGARGGRGSPGGGRGSPGGGRGSPAGGSGSPASGRGGDEAGGGSDTSY